MLDAKVAKLAEWCACELGALERLASEINNPQVVIFMYSIPKRPISLSLGSWTTAAVGKSSWYLSDHCRPTHQLLAAPASLA